MAFYIFRKYLRSSYYVFGYYVDNWNNVEIKQIKIFIFVEFIFYNGRQIINIIKSKLCGVLDKFFRGKKQSRNRDINLRDRLNRVYYFFKQVRQGKFY